jgi:transcriptional regulator with XRE-family HTH domain
MALQDVFIANLKKYRKQKKLTHEKLAEICDSDPRYISQIETGRRFPSIKFIEKIAAALHIAPYVLFFDELNSREDIQTRKQERAAMLIKRVSQEIQTALNEFD